MRRTSEARIDVCEHYVKQTLRNRCWIDSPQGALPLSIPVQKTEGKKALRDVRISDHGNWRHQHWNALVSSYGQSPYFEFYADDLAPFYEKRWTFLIDFNEDLIRLVAQLMDIELSWQRTTSYSGPADWEESVSEALKPYYQSFGMRHPFLPDLSCIDLLLNMGPESVFYL
jgi:hypothetical protein